MAIIKPNIYIVGVNQDVSPAELAEKIKLAAVKATDNFSWLAAGQTVLLKPALNSPDPYPATTHPLSIEVLTRLLEERGAKVVIGDQSGIEHLLHCPSGIKKGSSRKNYQAAGFGETEKFVGFEEAGWAEGFYHYQSPAAVSWPKGFHLTNWVKKVDHIVNLPRISTHVQAGVSLGFKNLVGLLREDSRVQFHANGPLYSFVKQFSKQTGLDTTDDKTGTFFEKIVEISLAVQAKMRLTLFTGTKVQATLGPDRQMLPVGGALFRSYEMTPEVGVVIASDNPVVSEAAALAFLILQYAKVPLGPKLVQKFLFTLNRQAKELGTEAVWAHPFVKHAAKLNLGEAVFRPEYLTVPNKLQEELNRLCSAVDRPLK